MHTGGSGCFRELFPAIAKAENPPKKEAGAEKCFLEALQPFEADGSILKAALSMPRRLHDVLDCRGQATRW